jgi:oligopeptide/dipeptide ABC transporter ATP-binding protein
MLEVDSLHTEFSTPLGTARAVRGVTFRVEAGETVGIVGESGCGKSVTALSIMGLIPTPPGRISSGSIRFRDRDLLSMRPKEWQQVRGGEISMIFQDPFSCLNPTMTVGAQITEAVRTHSSVSRTEAVERALQLLRQVQIPSPEVRLRQYPHEMSGGQRQRVMIAMAIASKPSLLIADEPTTALDVTVQAQIMALLREVQNSTGCAVILITHDVGVVAEMCSRVLVMYAGQVVESGTTAQVLKTPAHPYTVGLLNSLPQRSGHSSRRLPSIPGQPPPLTEQFSGCAFADRCPNVQNNCRTAPPPETDRGAGHTARCILHA